MTLYGGLPFKELRSKFLLAQTSTAQPLTPAVLPEGWSIIDLPGHCFAMTGFRTKDGNIYLGDCVSSEETLNKYGIGYLWDPAAYVATLEKVQALEAPCFIPAHAPATADIGPLARVNIAAVEETARRILTFCAEPASFEEILRQLFLSYGLTMNAQQYALIGSTLRSYLSWLYGRGLIGYSFENNRMLWHRK